MYPKTNKARYIFSGLFIAVVFFFCAKAEAQLDMRLDVEKETQKKVVLAITDFVFKGDGSDIQGIGKEAKGILRKDLILSELFSPLPKPIYAELESIERS